MGIFVKEEGIMPVAIKGVFHNGRIKPLEKIPYKGEREVVILFLDKSDKIWDNAVSKDFLKGYAEKDKVYDRL